MTLDAQRGNYAAAYGGMGESYALLGLLGFMQVDEAYSNAMAASKHAIDLDDNVAEAHVGLGLAAMSGAFAADHTETGSLPRQLSFEAA